MTRIWENIQIGLCLHLEEVEKLAVRVNRATGHPPLHCVANKGEYEKDVIEPGVGLSQHLSPRAWAAEVALIIHQQLRSNGMRGQSGVDRH